MANSLNLFPHLDTETSRHMNYKLLFQTFHIKLYKIENLFISRVMKYSMFRALMWIKKKIEICNVNFKCFRI